MLTRRQSEVLLFIDRHIKDRGYAPSFADIAAACALRSKSQVSAAVRILVARGFLRQLPGRSRAIEVLRLPVQPAPQWTPEQQCPDPMSILEDAVPILEIVAEERAATNGEPDDVLADLIDRMRAAVEGRTAPPAPEPDCVCSPAAEAACAGSACPMRRRRYAL